MLDDTPEGFERQMELLRRDPRAYIAMIDRELADDPDNSHLYFARYQAWKRLGDLHRAFDDIIRAIATKDQAVSRLCAGEILMQLGRYREALAMLARGEAMDTPERWAGMWGPHYQATCHAHLGEEAEAMAACDKLEDDDWLPGLHGTPRGDKAEVRAELRRRARAAVAAGKPLPPPKGCRHPDSDD